MKTKKSIINVGNAVNIKKEKDVLNLNKIFRESLKMLDDEARGLRAEHSLYVDAIIKFCLNAKSGVMVANQGKKKEQTVKFKYSKKNLKTASVLLKKYAEKYELKCKV